MCAQVIVCASVCLPAGLVCQGNHPGTEIQWMNRLHGVVDLLSAEEMKKNLSYNTELPFY